jgi:hypothetical protein
MAGVPAGEKHGVSAMYIRCQVFLVVIMDLPQCFATCGHFVYGLISSLEFIHRTSTGCRTLSQPLLGVWFGSLAMRVCVRGLASCCSCCMCVCGWGGGIGTVSPQSFCSLFVEVSSSLQIIFIHLDICRVSELGFCVPWVMLLCVCSVAWPRGCGD